MKIISYLAANFDVNEQIHEKRRGLDDLVDF